SMPDFDIDFCFERRGEVIDYVTQKYGSDRVGQIITFGTLKSKAVIRDVARALDLPYAEADAIAKLVPPGLKMTLEQALVIEPKLAELKSRGPVYEELIDSSLRLEGLARHASTHAAGIVIGREPLTNYVPLYRDPKTGSISTQYTMDQLEECGLVKMDFLGLKTLTLIKNTGELIGRRGIEFDIEKIRDDDGATFKMLGEGKSTCVFQFESSGMQGILKRAKPSSIEDLIALNALYRPGPMANIDPFIDSKTGKKPIAYPLPELENLLAETYGVICYQEQVMEIARMVAGYSLGQADILRKAMGKKKHEVMEKEKIGFVKGATERGYSKKQADDIFEMLVPFAGYGFNKSHSAAYSVLAYKTAYLKANFPAEFMAANLTNEINDTDKLAQYITETREMGIDVLPPNINLSEKYFSVADGAVVYGMMGIKNVGSAAVEEILRARTDGGDFSSFVDFLERVDFKIVNRKVIESLIQSGLFDTMKIQRRTLMHNLGRLLELVAKQKEAMLFGQTSLFGEEPEEKAEIPLEIVDEYPDLELLRLEKEHLGFFVSGHPLDKYRSYRGRRATLELARAGKAIAEKSYVALGMITAVRSILTKKGRPMAFGTLEDHSGTIEIVVFSDAWESYGHLIVEDAILGVEGKVDLSRGEPKLMVEKVMAPEALPEVGLSELHIRLDADDEDELYSLRSYLCDHAGNCSVFLHLPRGDSRREVVVRASSQIQVAPAKELIDGLRGLPKVEEVWQE
ncbi:MAG TPA: DNA polymerase III subunit alpha, partial [Spirochaetia bacterium]|nr:DNA polymerase III subunit alpha [Spirochaetia bacterium]